MAAFGSYFIDADNLRYRDELLGANYLLRRWTAISEEDCVGFCEVSQTPEMHEPGTFLLSIAVHPNYQGRGIGTELYGRARAELEEHNPCKLRSSCRADNIGSVVFLETRGFAVGMSIKELHLNIASFQQDNRQGSVISDFSNDKYMFHLCQEATGISIGTMQSMAADVNCNRKLYQLVSEIRQDMPTPQPASAVPFEEFVAGFLSAPTRMPEATFIAVGAGNGEYVGFSDLFDDGKNGLMAGLTGVRREYRNRGIASALKQRGLHYAVRNGFDNITTFNAVENAAILAVNTRLGFKEKFTWLHFEKHVSNG
jgi:ribosomal protein S18 acetylase RimI-like enzyme